MENTCCHFHAMPEDLPSVPRKTRHQVSMKPETWVFSCLFCFSSCLLYYTFFFLTNYTLYFYSLLGGIFVGLLVLVFLTYVQIALKHETSFEYIHVTGGNYCKKHVFPHICLQCVFHTDRNTLYKFVQF